WEAVVPVLQILSLGVFFRSAYKSCDTLVRSLGKPYRHAARQAIYASMVIGGAAIGTQWGLEGVAVGIFLAVALNYCIMSHFACSLLNFSLHQFVRGHLPLLWQFLFLTVSLQIFSWTCLLIMQKPAYLVIVNFLGSIIFLLIALRVAPRACKLAVTPWLLSKLPTNRLPKQIIRYLEKI
ncbi:MAG: hypothetical protein KDD62_01795, partial [Bdellovibrionales bacterium]|nr:hypothetical protein [Bdellovibrionales bacterium]